ncbi:hypothetical protein BgAZ_110010 [Babesia gibsoni]|uniref:t-SNARE coiled-coil homology domain-containing protein n=1 Tax=Babesia gibsoni TaxID=33632 RepID=A0AAD8PGJ3_BABGI|nr:hypothetical protein BgAZ_110010 [Babesia gibsoni]
MERDAREKSNSYNDVNEDTATAKLNLDNLDFSAQASLLLDHFAAITEYVRTRDKLKRDKGAHPLSQIKLTSKLTGRIQQARADLDVLANIYQKIVTTRRYRKRYTEEEIKNLEDTLHNLESQLSSYESSKLGTPKGAKTRSNVTFNVPETQCTFSASFIQLFPVSPEEEAIANENIKKWRQRDEHFDSQLEEIGEAVERIGNVAVTIGERATEQASKAIDTMTKVQNTTADLAVISQEIKRVLIRQRGIEFTMRIGIITLFLLVLSLFIFFLHKTIHGREKWP